MMRLLKLFAFIALSCVAAGGAALAQGTPAAGEAQGPSETAAYLFNTLLYLGAGGLILVMVAGFTLFQAGLAAQRHAGAIALRSVAVLAVSMIVTWLVGYNLLYGVARGDLLGPIAWWTPVDSDPVAAGHSAGAPWFFRAGVSAIGALIIAGALGERVRLRTLLVFSAGFAGVFYPIEASWSWGGGIIDAAFSFRDFAGASVIHVAGGWAALAG
ncbi:MAG TPA: hypothetical protein VNH64_09825, partial [Parvularculaceae bacterium]|nr:hypothetical protein [Parvularculaceae bacterium]